MHVFNISPGASLARNTWSDDVVYAPDKPAADYDGQRRE
jgi:hypothetical protein